LIADKIVETIIYSSRGGRFSFLNCCSAAKSSEFLTCLKQKWQQIQHEVNISRCLVNMSSNTELITLWP